jgi:hypothetical protein
VKIITESGMCFTIWQTSAALGNGAFVDVGQSGKLVPEYTVVSKRVACTAPDCCLARRVQPTQTAQQS